MPLPKSIQDQIDQAEALQRDLYTPAPLPEEEESEGKKAAEESAKQIDDQGAAQSAEPVTAKQEQDAPYWEHRFYVLQGKYNTEVPALRREVADLKQALEAAKSEKAQSSNASDLAETISSQLTEDEIELLGPELLNVMQKVVASSRQPDTQINELKQSVEQIQQDKSEEREARFWMHLNSQVPDWQQLQSTAEGQAWLKGVDPISGRLRNDLLIEAHKGLNAPQVITIFNQMRQETQSNTRLPASKVTPQQVRTTETVQPQGQAWSRETISQFYRDKTNGRYSEEEARQLEADLFKAQAEGRIY